MQLADSKNDLMSEKKVKSNTYGGAQPVIAGNEGVSQLIISTEDLSISSWFFETILGYERINSTKIPSEDWASNSIAFLTPNGFTLQLVIPIPELSSHSPSNIISLTVKKFNAVKEKLKEFNIEVCRESFDNKTLQRKAFFKAPDGTLFQLCGYEDSNNHKDEESLKKTPPHQLNMKNHTPTAEDLFNALGHRGVEWILIPTQKFDQMIDFFTKVMGYPIVTKGIPQSDLRYTRYALFATPTGVPLELVETTREASEQFSSPVPSFTVENISQSAIRFQELELKVLTEIIGSEKWGWFYFYLPEMGLFQLQGSR